MRVQIVVDAENVHIDVDSGLADIQAASGVMVRGSVQDAVDALDLTYGRVRRMLTAARKDAP